MTIYLCHERPDLLEFEAEVLDARPGRVLLSRSALHPGGGGQVCDRASLEHASGLCRVLEILKDGHDYWHILDTPVTLAGKVRISIDAGRRGRLSQLHTVSHILNALVYQEFAGALVTGAQINADGTGRMDFDLPEADNDRLRALEGPINGVIKRGLPVRACYVPASEAGVEHGLIRSQSVAPPVTPDGMLRIVEIVGLDRQACGGTHIADTAMSAPMRVTKIENKGRHNRRVKLALLS